MSNIDYEAEMPEGLRHHLESLANSCAYYYDELIKRDMPEELSDQLVLSWHNAKVGSWRDAQTNGRKRLRPDEDGGLE